MPLQQSSDFGTNADKSQNDRYCHYCYQDGKFADEGITLEGKIVKSIDQAIKMGMPKAAATKMAREVLPTLERWK